MLKTLPLLLLFIVFLAGCVVDRTAADEKLIKGCAAGASLFLNSGYEIKEITSKTSKESAELGNGFRDITINAIISDG